MADQEAFAKEDSATLIALGLIVLASSFSIFAFYFLIKVCRGLDKKPRLAFAKQLLLAASTESLENENSNAQVSPLKFSLFQEYYSCERVSAATLIGFLTTGISFMTFLGASGDIDVENGIISTVLSILLGLAVVSALICAFHYFCGSVTVEEKGNGLEV